MSQPWYSQMPQESLKLISFAKKSLQHLYLFSAKRARPGPSRTLGMVHFSCLEEVPGRIFSCE